MSYAIRDEYWTMFGREVLTVWSGDFASVYVGEAMQLPKGDGYMVTIPRTFRGWMHFSNLDETKVRVTCESPRTDENYERVDAAISDAVAKHYESLGD